MDIKICVLVKTGSNEDAGIGPLTSSALMTEIGAINRFPHIDHLSSFVGFIPRVRESGETIHTGGITFRCNAFLRILLIEASWQAIRMDPALMQYYHKHLVKLLFIALAVLCLDC